MAQSNTVYDPEPDTLDPDQQRVDKQFAGLTSPEHLDRDAEPGSLYNPGGDTDSGGNSESGDATPTSELKNLEEGAGDIDTPAPADKAAADEAGGLYNAEDPPPGRLRGRFSFNKRKSIATGLIVAAVGGGGIFGAGVLSGPFQFVHIAQQLTHMSFSHQNDAGDNRVGRLTRFMRSGAIGETRLTYVESKFVKDPTLAQLKKLGLTLNLDNKTGLNKGVFVTTTDAGSPYHGKTNAEIKADLTARYGQYGSVNQIADGKFYIKDTSLSGRLATKIVSETNYSKIGTAVRARILGKFTFASWHPLKVLDRKLNQKASTFYDEWKKNRTARLKTGVQGATIDATGAAETGPVDANGNPTTIPEPGAAGTPTASDFKSTLNSIKSSGTLKIAGGVAAAVGLVCAAKAVDDNIGAIRYAQVIAPLIRMGMDAITVGSQIMTGQDVDIHELAILSQQFNAVTSTGVSASWSGATPIKNANGESGGIDLPSGTKDVINQGAPSWLNWTQTQPVPALCSTAGQVTSGIVSVVVGVFSGGILSTVGGIVVGAVGGPLVIDKLSNLLSGGAVNVASGGAEWGSDIAYGARLGANASGLPLGGVALTDKQVGELDATTNAQDKASFKSESFAARTLNPYDYRTLASKLLDNAGTTPSQTASILRSGLFSFGSSLLSLPSKLFSSTVHASPKLYQYPFPEYGFSQEDLNNPLVADPYANADAAATILDNNGQNGTPDYIAKALQCFAVTITKGDQGWDVIPADQSPGSGFNPYDGKYDNASCIDAGNVAWLRIRFFILDTGVLEGLACYLGDDRSCSNDGFATAGASVADVVAPILASDPSRALSDNVARVTQPITHSALFSAPLLSVKAYGHTIGGALEAIIGKPSVSGAHL